MLVMLNTAEAARFLRVSQASIRRWSDSGRLPATRVGGRRERRFKESDLVAFMDHSSGRSEGVVNIGGAQVSAPGHLASFYSSDEGGMRLSIPFLAEGLRHAQPCILVAREPMVSRYTTALNVSPGEGFNLMSRRYPVVVICQYDARVFSGAALVRALKAHPDLFDLRLGSFLN